MQRVRMLALLGLLSLAVAPLAPSPATAGCGCDHPPPTWAPVMPAFGSPGKTIRIWADGFAYEVGASYEVGFENGDTSHAVATTTEYLDAKVPPFARPGPARIRVEGPGVDHEYDAARFTVLSPAPMVPNAQGAFVYLRFEGSVTADGTLLIPFNLSEVGDATQFAIGLRGLGLAYGADDVVFYNADGVDLTLFTLQVDNPVERQWGSYYGWQVEQDSGIQGEVFGNQTSSGSFFGMSDLLHYWRHEFHSYHEAHAPGGSHEVGADGFHLGDGTLHIDHDHLVLAIDGEVAGNALDAGAETFDVFVVSLQSENPIEPSQMQWEMLQALFSNDFDFMLMESPDAYDDDDDDDDDDD